MIPDNFVYVRAYILNKWKKYCSHFLNVQNVSDVRWIELHTAEPLATGSCSQDLNCYCKDEKV
jgi:hypothetical protein